MTVAFKLVIHLYISVLHTWVQQVKVTRILGIYLCESYFITLKVLSSKVAVLRLHPGRSYGQIYPFSLH